MTGDDKLAAVAVALHPMAAQLTAAVAVLAPPLAAPTAASPGELKLKGMKMAAAFVPPIVPVREPGGGTGCAQSIGVGGRGGHNQNSGPGVHNGLRTIQSGGGGVTWSSRPTSCVFLALFGTESRPEEQTNILGVHMLGSKIIFWSKFGQNFEIGKFFSLVPSASYSTIGRTL